jgi:hypothetical protein
VACLGRGSHAGRVSDLAYHNSLMVQIWSALAARDARLMAVALSRFALRRIAVVGLFPARRAARLARLAQLRPALRSVQGAAALSRPDCRGRD